MLQAALSCLQGLELISPPALSDLYADLLTEKIVKTDTWKLFLFLYPHHLIWFLCILQMLQATFEATREALVARPWAVDHLDAILKRWRGAPHAKAIVFVDNAGSDFVLGVPFIRSRKLG